MYSAGLVAFLFSALLGAAVTDDGWDRQLTKGIELANAGRFTEARQALQAARDQAAAADPGGTRMALALNNLGTVHLRLHEIPEAEQFYRRAAEIWAAHGDVVNRLSPVTNLAGVYIARRQFTAAERLLHSQLQLVMEKLGPGHQQVAVILTYLADVAFLQGDNAGAAQRAERALELVRRARPAGHPDIATALNNLGSVYRAQHRLEESSRLYTEALEIMQASGQPDHPAWIRAYTDYSTVRFDQGRYEDAKSYLREALAHAERTLGPNHPTVASILSDYAAVLRKTRNKTEAKKAEQRAARILAQSREQNQVGYTVDLRTLSGFR